MVQRYTTGSSHGLWVMKTSWVAARVEVDVSVWRQPLFEPHHKKTCLRGFATWYDSNWSAQLQRVTRGIIQSRQRTTKVLIRLHGCAG